jgi:hypothetical protein
MFPTLAFAVCLALILFVVSSLAVNPFRYDFMTLDERIAQLKDDIQQNPKGYAAVYFLWLIPSMIIACLFDFTSRIFAHALLGV